MMTVPDAPAMTMHADAQRNQPTLLLLGGGGHAAVVADAAHSAGWSLAGYVDDLPPRDSESRLPRLNYLGRIEDVPTIVTSTDSALVLHAAIGDNHLRRRWLDRFADLALAKAIVHPSAVVSSSAQVLAGCFIGPRAVVNPRAEIAHGCIINTAAIIEHDCMIEDCCHIAPGAILCGNVRVQSQSLIGAGAVVLPGCSIGVGCTVAAGAVVIDDLPAHATAIGVPARIATHTS